MALSVIHGGSACGDQNYLGEIIQAVALSLPATLLWMAEANAAPLWWVLLPWAYPLYYLAIFIPRAIDDDAVCLAKYGPVWQAYTKLVPYRLVPYVW
jgi:delta14-sterol reductase